MDLLGQEKKEMSKKKKMVLALLISFTILLILLICIIMALPKKSRPKQYVLSIDDRVIQISDNTIIMDSDGKIYISLKDIATPIGNYTYCDGEYQKYNDDKTKCYLQNGDEVVGFEADKNTVYKTVSGSIIDFQYYDLQSNIISSNNELYINVDDMQVAFNMLVSNVENGNNIQINIYTVRALIDFYSNKIAENGLQMAISRDYNNGRAISYNMIIESQGGKFGVVDTDFNSIISNKYNSITFNEFTQNFTFTIDNNKTGLMDKAGHIMVNPRYDRIRIINYSPVLYEVQDNGKYGILKESGDTLVNTEYDKFGYEGDSSKNASAVLVIPNIHNSQSGIVASKNGKYGIIDLSTGKEIAPCVLDSIYARITQSTNKIEYYVLINGVEKDLSVYLDYVYGSSANNSNTINDDTTIDNI